MLHYSGSVKMFIDFGDSNGQLVIEVQRKTCHVYFLVQTSYIVYSEIPW